MALKAVVTSGLLGCRVSGSTIGMLSKPFLNFERKLGTVINLIFALDQFISGSAEYCDQRIHSGRQQLAIAALAVASFAAGYGVSFWFDSRQPEDAYANYMSQCVFLGDSEDQCAEEWRSMDAQERFFYSEGGRRAQA